MVLSVQFDKRVKIENRRLALMYYFLLVALLAFTCWNFIDNKSYLTSLEVYGKVHYWATNYWFYGDGAEKIDAEYAEKAFCTSPADYNYCDTPDCAWHYHDAKCLKICTQNQVENCFPANSRWFKEDTGIFLPTYYNETIQMHNAASISTKQVYVKGVEELGIAFHHEYFLENLKQDREQGSSQEDTGKGTPYPEGMLTIWVDEDENEIARWKPGKAVELSVRDILQHIKTQGVDIDSINTDFRNHLDGAKYPDGVLTRISGLSISISLSYSNHHYMDELSDSDFTWQGPVCFLTLYAATPWTSKPIIQTFDENGSTMQRYFYGIRFKFESTGRFVWVDISKVTALVTTLLVWMGFAKQAVYQFSIHALGSLSEVYKRVLVQPLKIKSEIIGLAARLVSVSESFKSLEDTKEGISKGRLFRRFRSIFKETEELDEGEIRRFTTYVFGTLSGQASGQNAGVSIEEYAEACSSNEPLHFQDLVNVFDADKKKTIMEKIFADDSLRQVFESDKILSDDNEDLETKGPTKTKTSMDCPPVVAPSGIHVDVHARGDESLETTRLRAEMDAKQAKQEKLIATLMSELAELRQTSQFLQQKVSSLEEAEARRLEQAAKPPKGICLGA
eukprot:gnl/MRDRNA2_/MRDRNA2_14274_c0_seq1.p1 gnl/MRDRNA2_/MRDRNA2_14274_c0~~gnl/MRDRNA2_/MRDRNA2_14274_c0_seq1.p1  ORF type:complete len:620 (+),score=94.74 gnl/MRDRNA2_/MRDRNA2_14274_c0_seq1:158-2017(+)